ncbi:conjugal transfer protein TraD [Pseudoxanthomonas winnipegensis]|uniref:Conjugal transfer protein TraD n=1 Tax=Pseudoxanthomonas winnipegensis TaxID=2480810 RepID=A0A4Q8M5C4_9GAMM|nr:conjugal transfer protein TraD [Pseudoxanthomonas winnipegensis]TAA44923.1 hypothetical protein EA655_08480 [Pseudoxanthomonas winnipegensis]
MTATDHYRDQIKRATERMAQLHARELLADQRRESKAREMVRREEAKRRQRVADLVFLAGAQALDDGELVGALLKHLASREEPEVRSNAISCGATFLAKSPATRLALTS